MFLIFAAAIGAMTPGNFSPICVFDKSAMLALREDDFDQGENGWRSLANDPRCFVAAAHLIKDFRLAHPRHGSMLYWHEGQMRAAAGRAEQAIPLFVAARSGRNEWNVDSGWNHYVDATVAFLRRDLSALRKARQTLASLPPPAEQLHAEPAARTQGRPSNWPPNLDVVDGLLRCFDQPYAEAVNPTCRSASAPGR